MNKLTISIVAVAILVGGYFLLNSDTSNESNYKNISYMIEGESVKLADSTAYFGNELKTDLDGDGAEDDVAFIVTQNRGGSGTFFYAVAALNTENGYAGSDGYLLGDRIAPQSTTISPNPRHKYVVVFNYADRAVGEPMTAQPSVGKSAYLKLNPTTMQWGIVVPNFEGESR